MFFYFDYGSGEKFQTYVLWPELSLITVPKQKATALNSDLLATMKEIMNK